MNTHEFVNVADVPSVMLNVAGVEWRFSITSVRRTGRDVFVRVLLSGVDVCTATIQIHDRLVPGVTAREILARVCDWLMVRGTARDVFIALGVASSAAMPRRSVA